MRGVRCPNLMTSACARPMAGKPKLPAASAALAPVAPTMTWRLEMPLRVFMSVSSTSFLFVAQHRTNCGGRQRAPWPVTLQKSNPIVRKPQVSPLVQSGAPCQHKQTSTCRSLLFRHHSEPRCLPRAQSRHQPDSSRMCAFVGVNQHCTVGFCSDTFAPELMWSELSENIGCDSGSPITTLAAASTWAKLCPWAIAGSGLRAIASQ